MSQIYVAIDGGTTNTRIVLVDDATTIIGREKILIGGLYPSFCVNTKKCKKRKCIFARSFIDLLIAF